MSRFGYLLHRLDKRLGWPMLAGLALAGLSTAFYLGVGLSTDRRLHALERQVAAMRSAIARHGQAWVPESPRASLRTFYAALPPERAAPDRLEKIFDAAYENDVELERGEFKLEREPDAAFVRYRIMLPATGSYAGIRAFANRVLKENPSAALDGIGFSREDTKTPEVDARVRFTLYLAAGK